MEQIMNDGGWTRGQQKEYELKSLREIIGENGSWHDANHFTVDIRGKVHLFNRVRPITWRRRFKAWLGFVESDTMICTNGFEIKSTTK